MRLARLLTLAALAGALGALVLYDALPGINWLIWTVVVVAGLLAYRHPDAGVLRALVLPLGFAVVLSAGASVTTTPLLILAVLAIVASLLALAMLLAREPGRAHSYGALEILTAPIRGFAHTLEGALRAAMASIESADSARAHPALRGSLIAAPVVVVFALLFATADPLFARGRDAILDVLGTWAFLPRLVFGVVLTLFVLGAYAASLPTASPPHTDAAKPPSRIGVTEWRIVLGATAAISWLFVVFQLSYLFGSAPAVAGSGITFAEYAHRGFGELALAATGAALLIVRAESRAPSAGAATAHRALALPSLALLAAVGCILVSAFHRITLYEDAYGYTTMRVYVQAYLIMTFVLLAVLAWHVLRAFDVRALARQVMTVALATLTLLVVWNGDAWVASANLERFAHTGKLDVPYLTRGLSPDAYPTLVGALPRLPLAERTQLAAALVHEYARRPNLRTDASWYEWNARRTRARHALLALGAAPR